MYNVFHALLLKAAVSFVLGLSGITPSAFWSPEDDPGEFEVENILDSCFVHHSR